MRSLGQGTVQQFDELKKIVSQTRIDAAKAKKQVGIEVRP